MKNLTIIILVIISILITIFTDSELWLKIDAVILSTVILLQSWIRKNTDSITYFDYKSNKYKKITKKKGFFDGL